MNQRLKRWESPRKQGRNSKGKGGSARRRQKQKQLKRLSQRLKQGNNPQAKPKNREEHEPLLPIYF